MPALRGWVELCAKEDALKAPTQQTLADRFGRKRSTVSRWATDPRYIERVAELRAEYFKEQRQSVALLVADAVTALRTAIGLESEQAGSLALQFLDKLGMIVPVDEDAAGASRSPVREQLDRKIIQAAERFGHRDEASA